MNERISVVIPVLDDAQLLELCLDSLAEQDRKPDEVIVVDNGCTDDSAAVARSFGARVIAEPRRGITLRLRPRFRCRQRFHHRPL